MYIIGTSSVCFSRSIACWSYLCMCLYGNLFCVCMGMWNLFCGILKYVWDCVVNIGNMFCVFMRMFCVHYYYNNNIIHVN